MRSTWYLNGPRLTWAFVAVDRKSDRLTLTRGSHDAGALVAAIGAATTSPLASPSPLIA